ncbi:FAD-dependent oxidoreductase [Burkholderia cenocepacia]|uniref:FAD-dependent monooxygenase n=2 Tax=Burkholderia cenocepacia TaxID=95486 RepID=A0ABD4UNF9_9BURK|nr:FAD-dependent monooxygenase [Burkholderia cenocepacia]MCW3703297.1 FAD-dependent monooxygenase [Burkholderia cenocepacia]MCW3715896.1 FAD-dependent monooxygenase [Burkholderia cenocepacia]MCW3733428.1 FAD-dependent monooxygenase [Burkholderia cenocepacia]
MPDRAPRAANGERSMHDIHVAIVGAGLGGLALAQALKQAGIAFDVYERDAAIDSRRQGYRIRIDATGQRALAACLPAGPAALFRASASQGTGAVRLATPRLTPAHGHAPAGWHTAPDTADLSVNRLTLREILMAGIEDHVHVGHAVDRYRVLPDGRAHVTFASGTSESVTCDVLVGADGIHSTLRAQLVPAAAPVRTGALCVYGWTRLPTDDPAFPEAAGLRAATTVIVADGCAAVLEDMRFRTDLRALAAHALPCSRFTPPDDYFYWAAIGPSSRFGLDDADPTAALAARIPAALQHVVRDWHPVLRRLLLDTPSDAVTALPVRRGRPDVALPAGPVTLLGDAIHAMSPAGGAGANTALRDAAALAARLAGQTANDGDIRHALTRYAEDMRVWATDAVIASDRAAARLFAGN